MGGKIHGKEMGKSDKKRCRHLSLKHVHFINFYSDFDISVSFLCFSLYQTTALPKLATLQRRIFLKETDFRLAYKTYFF